VFNRVADVVGPLGAVAVFGIASLGVIYIVMRLRFGREERAHDFEKGLMQIWCGGAAGDGRLQGTPY
jgi:hypothetical protein